MANINVLNLARLADKDIEAQAVDFGALPLDIRNSLETLAAERNKQITDAAASEILDLLQLKDGFVTSTAAEIVKLQGQIDGLKALGTKIARQVAYGNSTLNYLPLAKQMGFPVPVGSKALKDIPADWTAPVAVVAAAAA
jgi:hypothetical protein